MDDDHIPAARPAFASLPAEHGRRRIVGLQRDGRYRTAATVDEADADRLVRLLTLGLQLEAAHEVMRLRVDAELAEMARRRAERAEVAEMRATDGDAYERRAAYRRSDARANALLDVRVRSACTNALASGLSVESVGETTADAVSDALDAWLDSERPESERPESE